MKMYFTFELCLLNCTRGVGKHSSSVFFWLVWLAMAGSASFLSAETWMISDGSTATFSSTHQNQDILIETNGKLLFNDANRVPQQTTPITITNHGTVEFDLPVPTGTGTGSTNNLAAQGNITLTGSGTFVKKGAGYLATNTGSTSFTVTMSEEGWIDIQEGTFVNGSHNQQYWENNKGNMNIGSSGTLCLWDGISVYVDKLTGSGKIMSNHSNLRGPLVVGVSNGSSTFEGSISGYAAIKKTGTGTLTLQGTNTSSGTETYPSLAVEGGVVKLEKEASAGTGNVSVGIAGKLEFAKSEATSVPGQIAGSGTILHTGTGTTSFTSENNTFSGSLKIEKGIVQANSLGLASLQLDSSGTFEITGNGNEIMQLHGSGTLIKKGTGKWTFHTNSTFQGKTELAGGTLVANPSCLTGGLKVTEDAVYEPYLPQPWKLTLYSGKGNIEPNETGYDASFKGTAWDMKQCANNISTNRDFISNNSTLSYSTNIYVTEETPITVAGQFDDWAGIFIRTIEDDGSYGVWEAILPFVFHAPINNNAMQKTYTLQPGYYQLDARVGDNTGAACAYNNFGEAIGLGILEGHQVTSLANTYQPMEIDPQTGILAGIESIHTIDIVKSIDFPIEIAAEKTLTFSPTVVYSGTLFQSELTGSGTLKLTNPLPEKPVKIRWQTSTEGNLHLTEGIHLYGKGAIGGNLTLEEGTLLHLSATEDFSVGGNWTSLGKTQIVVDLTGIQENQSWLTTMGDVEISADTKFLFVSDSTAMPAVTFTFFEGTDSTEWLEWWENAVDFSQVSDFLNYTNVLADANGLHITVGDKNALPEPATWLLILLSAGTGLVFQKSIFHKRERS